MTVRPSVSLLYFRKCWKDFEEYCIEGLGYRLFERFKFGSYRTNIIPTLYEAVTEFHRFYLKKLIAHNIST